MLSWVGKRPLREVRAFPAQVVERFGVDGSVNPGVDWSRWPDRYERGGLLFHGDNKEVLAHLLANGFRGKVDLIYIDPPFDSGADYVRRVRLRGASGSARLDGESYTLGEQIQYTDIWANDTYLQFMYERLLLLKELLADGGSVFLHCDSAKGHHLRALLDEVFGPERFLNEIIWSYRRWPSDTDAYQAMHDTILYYVAPGKKRHTFHRRYEEASSSYMERFGGKTQRLDEESGTRKITSDEPTKGMPRRDVWEISIVAGFKKERTAYPTQKPEALLERILEGSSNPGDIVLDCFIGSGTTAAVAQKLGRRWIGADINKGAIQTTTKRVASVMTEQTAGSVSQQQTLLGDERGSVPLPAQLAFTTWRVNDYDLAIQHNEAVNLACEHLGVERSKTDAFFDGTLGNRLAKIVPFNHAATPLDLQAAADELARRPDEPRDAVLVALGRELGCEAWLEKHNRHRPINKLEIIELRSDPKYGHFFEHRPASARVRLERSQLVIDDFMSPSMLERLAQIEGVLAPQITEWRSMVDSVMIDTAYDGKVFNVVVADVPERKADLVAGIYDLDLPKGKRPVAVKVTDMLGEDVLVILVRPG